MNRQEPTTDVGALLHSRGCRQGALIDVPARILRLCSRNQCDPWTAGDDVVPESRLAVVSQDCDIVCAAAVEPFVEAIAATWISDRGEIHTARKGNSSRSFLLSETEGKALIADARRRVQIEKEALLSSTFTEVVPSEDARRRFAEWLAGRYDRPAVENALVNAVHKPIVKALDRAFRKGEEIAKSLERISELRFSVVTANRMTVDFIAMLDDGDAFGAEEEAELAGWLHDTLVSEDGPVEEVRMAVRQPTTISLHDYVQTTRLQLDQYSQPT